MIDRYQLRYFLAVVDHGNFSRAATNCHVSQPTLSAGIAKLERFLGTPLFLRSSQRVELTSAGTRFLDHARRIESEFNLALQAATAATDRAVLRVGMLRSVPGALVAGAIAGMLAIDPDARVELVGGSERELIGHVARGRVDCAVTLVGRGGDRFLDEPLIDEGYALALPATHPLAGEAVIEAEALAAEVMIVRRHCEALSETSRHFTERGVRPHFAYRSTNDERVLAMIAGGLGLTVMPDAYVAAGVARPKLAGFKLRRSIGLIYAANAEGLATTPPAFVAALRKHLG
ncbi:LysR family transcriptional regulator [Sphingomonas qomolangmaensis]|uniref:LysR family transcriptional regulator n=1 Tax=Sphingomonas qomolangmaensis TaxID=2918765 RepID=A0ABY5L2U5_9SPHN|nr:LysR family transcriptional regulator [Sphingomonas qomolangmaensis]UUL81260.1 LysR family transcriptional regulator [Sphingomonas qomolangmaensis]